MYRNHRLTVSFCVMMVFSLGCNFVQQLTGVQGSGKREVSHEPPALPAPPKGMPALQHGSPEEQAVYFANLLLSGDSDKRLAAWISLYGALGVPVIGQDGVPLGNTGDDPIGPRYWQVWYASGLDLSGRGIPLSDAGRLIAAGLPGVDGVNFSQIFFNDLRSATQSAEPQVRLMGLFVRERVLRGTSHVDILDVAITPDVAVIDLPTAQLLSWIVLRVGMFHSTSQSIVSEGSLTLAGYHPQPPQKTLTQLGPQLSCSDVPGAGSDAAYWANWIANKIGGGFQLSGMQKAFPSLVERVLGKAFTNTASEIGGKVLGYTNVVTSGFSLIMQLMAMEINPTADPDPLVRTKMSGNPGKDGVLSLQLYSSPGNLPHGDELESCLASFFYNALGVSFSFPSEGPISGAEISVKGGMGFPGLVLFNINGARSRAQTMRDQTDAKGFASFKILGAPQRRDLPDNAKPVRKEFSVIVSAQPEEAGLNSMANIFLSGLMSGSGAGGLSMLIDILKTFSYDMGEYVFDITDWATGYHVDGSFYKAHIFGDICSGLDVPFTLDLDTTVGLAGTITFTPSNENGGTWSLEGAFPPYVTSEGTGSYTIESNGTAPTAIVIQDGIFIQNTVGFGSHSTSATQETIWVEPAGDGCSP